MGARRSPGAPREGPLPGKHARRIVQAAAAIFVFWLILTAPPTLADWVLGALAAAALGSWSVSFLWSGGGPDLGPRQLIGLGFYTVGLVRSIVPAALQVARIVLRPVMRINPLVITHRMSLDNATARIALANSVTLTPGTHCVDSEGEVLTIHCLDEDFADAIQSGRLEASVARALARETRR